MNRSEENKGISEIIKNEWLALLAALHFLTIIPSFSRKIINPEELGRSVRFYPLIGVLIGLSLLGIDRILNLIFPTTIAGVLLIAYWIGVSGGLHFDGFLDSCDGLLGGNNPEERLRIMKDERVGAFGLINGVLLLVTKIYALSFLDIYRDQALLMAPIISRWGMSIAIVGFPYGRSVGLGKGIKDHAKKVDAIIATLITLIGGYLISGIAGMIIIGIAFLFILGISFFITGRIPGLTGDSYGAINEIAEVLVLLAFTSMTKLF